jgi:hypothetical protein
MEKDKIDIISAKYELTEWNLVSNLYEVMWKKTADFVTKELT